MLNLINQVFSYIQKHEMLRENDNILVGVSGGPDSITLLHILWMLKDKLKISLYVAHLNHLLRGDDAAEDALLVQKFAREYNLPCFVESIDIRSLQKQTGLCLQEAARVVRFEFFERLSRRFQIQKVALGHHADDLAETILYNLLRGSGPDGLKGISPVRGVYIRPLLEVRRCQIEDHCLNNSLPTRQDLSNLKLIYTRNRIRLTLLPLLEREYNPRLVNALVRLGNICREENDYLEQLTQEAYRKVAEEKNEGEVILFKPLFLAQPPPLKRRVLRLAWRRVSGEAKEISYDHVERLLKMLQDRPSGGALDLPGGIKAQKETYGIRLFKRRSPQVVQSFECCLTVPGITSLPWLGQEILADLIPAEKAPPYNKISPREALIDYSLVKSPLLVRQRREGDVFKPLGLGGTMKLKKFLIDQKIPRERRDLLPLVVAGEEIIWVGGLRLAERLKVTEKTTLCLYLRLRDKTH